MVNLQEPTPVSLGELSAQLHEFLAANNQTASASASTPEDQQQQQQQEHSVNNNNNVAQIESNDEGSDKTKEVFRANKSKAETTFAEALLLNGSSSTSSSPVQSSSSAAADIVNIATMEIRKQQPTTATQAGEKVRKFQCAFMHSSNAIQQKSI